MQTLFGQVRHDIVRVSATANVAIMIWTALLVVMGLRAVVSSRQAIL